MAHPYTQATAQTGVPVGPPPPVRTDHPYAQLAQHPTDAPTSPAAGLSVDAHIQLAPAASRSSSAGGVGSGPHTPASARSSSGGLAGTSSGHKPAPAQSPSSSLASSVSSSSVRHIPRQGRLNAANAKQYRKRVLVHAFRSQVAPTLGKAAGREGDYIVVNCSPAGTSPEPVDVYPVPYQTFLETYEEVPGRPHVFRKKQPVWAARLMAACELLTQQGMIKAKEGDWLVQNPMREDEQNYRNHQYIVAHEVFVETYEPYAGDQGPPGPVPREAPAPGPAPRPRAPGLPLAAAGSAGLLVGYLLARLIHRR